MFFATHDIRSTGKMGLISCEGNDDIFRSLEHSGKSFFSWITIRKDNIEGYSLHPDGMEFLNELYVSSFWYCEIFLI